MKYKPLLLLIAFTFFQVLFLTAQTIPKEELIFLTSEWKGDRFPDGRPRIPDDLLTRARKVGIEEVWQILNNEGYVHQYEAGWKMVHQDVPVIGRAMTANYMPIRPDVQKNILERGTKQGRKGEHLHWPINALTKGDVYVADNRGREGGLIGDNLGNIIFKNSGNGVVFDGVARDVDGLAEIKGFNAFVRDFKPHFMQGVILMGLNTPITIGRAIVLPGDLVIAGRTGVVFVPAHMAEQVIETAEFIDVKDRFGHEMIAAGRYDASQVDSQWPKEIREHFLKWLDSHPEERKITAAKLDQFMLKRTW